MAYRKRTTARGRSRASARRTSSYRGSAYSRPARRSTSRSGSGRAQTLRIVLQQPQAAPVGVNPFNGLPVAGPTAPPRRPL